MKTEFTDISTELESWYAREHGQYLLTAIRKALTDILDTAFGYHLLQLGITHTHPLFAASPINHCIYCTSRGGDGIGLVAEPDELPLDGDSIDTVIAHHSLEFADNPHQVLREIQRVLTPQGQLFIIGFNPFSLCGAGHALRALSQHSLWHRQHAMSERRVSDWLHLLGCEVLDIHRLYLLPPFGGGRIRTWSMRLDDWAAGHNLPGGGLYIVHAVKQVSALNRPRVVTRSPRERLMGLAVPKPGAVPSPTPARPGHPGIATQTQGESVIERG